jgi:hypothetical protein
VVLLLTFIDVATPSENVPGLPGVTVPVSQLTLTLPAGSTVMPVYVQLAPLDPLSVTVNADAGMETANAAIAANAINVRRSRDRWSEGFMASSLSAVGSVLTGTVGNLCEYRGIPASSHVRREV